ncbi:uncharacterized protein clmnb [Stigmatopora argus]
MRKRTFCRWMNVFLQRCNPPLKVHDLFKDIQDGRILMALLEELTGCKLLYRLRSSTHRMLKVSNISKALAFLDERHVKLLGIDAAGIVDGVPSVVLNLIWSVILHFQVKKVLTGLQGDLSPNRSSVSVSSYPSSANLSLCSNGEKSDCSNTLPQKCTTTFEDSKCERKAIRSLLLWGQRCVSKFGVEVHNFGKSWRSGLAFLALIKSINPTLVNLKESLSMEPMECLQQAFSLASNHLNIPSLLDPKDLAYISPDEKSIITYVSLFMGYYSDIDKDQVSQIAESIPQIPNFGSVKSAAIGRTTNPAAQSLFECLEKSHERELWERWARKSSGSHSDNSSNSAASDISTFSSCHGCNVAKRPQQEASQLMGKKVRLNLQPLYSLEAGGINQEIRSWMEKGSKDHGCSKTRVEEGHFSMSSEEGIYSLSAPDSEEEDDYSYMKDLSIDVFLPSRQLRKGESRVEEETVEEIILDGEKFKHLKSSTSLVSLAHGNELERVSTGQNHEVTNFSEEKKEKHKMENAKLKDDNSRAPKSSHFRKGGFFLQFSAASCDINPLELEMLLLLWILLYCCLIVPQMSL